MKKFVLIVNALKDRNLEETRSLCSYIKTRGGSCTYLVSVDEQERIRKIHAQDIPKETECMIVLGGDGTADTCGKRYRRMQHSADRREYGYAWLSL